MTNPLTDAVRRLKELQQDVERLQSAEDEEGEPRLFFTTQEQAQATEETRIGPDIPAFEQANATDRQAKLVLNDILGTDVATAADIQEDLRLQRTQNDDGFYNSIGYNVSSYDDGDVVLASRLRLQFAETAVAVDTVALNPDQIPQTDTGSATDTSSLRSRTVVGGTYNDTNSGYNITAYQ
jgi:hypothetical protein